MSQQLSENKIKVLAHTQVAMTKKDYRSLNLMLCLTKITMLMGPVGVVKIWITDVS